MQSASSVDSTHRSSRPSMIDGERRPASAPAGNELANDAPKPDVARRVPRKCGTLAHEHVLALYLPIAVLAASIFAFTASRLKLAPFCIGGNSIAVMASFSTCCWTKTKRQNSYLNHWKYSCEPALVPFSGHPVRSKGSRRRLVRYGTSTLVLSPSQPADWSMKRYL